MEKTQFNLFIKLNTIFSFPVVSKNSATYSNKYIQAVADTKGLGWSRFIFGNKHVIGIRYGSRAFFCCLFFPLILAFQSRIMQQAWRTSAMSCNMYQVIACKLQDECTQQSAEDQCPKTKSSFDFEGEKTEFTKACALLKVCSGRERFHSNSKNKTHYLLRLLTKGSLMVHS